MDLTSKNWQEELGDILTHISKAQFVALDFEMSGISLKSNGAERKDSGATKQTLEQRYLEVKQAAEKYQVLQVGITIVEAGDHNEAFMLRPYNMSMTPIIKNNIGIDREFMMLGGCVTFLIDHGFDFQKCLTSGVPYLSHHEEELARFREDQRREQVAPEELPAEYEFVCEVRRHIKKWLYYRNRNIGFGVGIELWNGPFVLHGVFTAVQRQLILQLLSAEFEELTGVFFQGYAQISDRTKGPAAKYVTQNREMFEAKLHKQIGVRYIMDALTAPDNLIDCDVPSSSSSTSDSDKSSLSPTGARLEMHLDQRQSNPPILIGHNIFVDLVNFYACFIGPLPETVKEFTTEIHKLFPRIIDTKYLAMHLEKVFIGHTNLALLDKELENMLFPRVVTHPDYTRYTTPPTPALFNNGFDGPQPHEAGYDSCLTATVAMRLLRKYEENVKRLAWEQRRSSSTSDTDSEASLPADRSAMEELEDAFGESSRDTVASSEYSVGIFESIFDSSSDFWKTHGNRLQINGTEEKFLCLEDLIPGF